ncbi:glycoside hydrolase family 2 protein [Demequina sp. NBRC 110056]|uniref:glycoside hydrolase family 2 protein n=1 Tax=Demequina sp. NBRC 110056 TaxID=1570345 RepID=UPI000A06759F|nr:glycoside hydrolase family 2 protein [Demequina sp. NBRC 110056]
MTPTTLAGPARTRIDAGWTVTARGASVPAEVLVAGAVPAAVPGTVTTDLLAAGLIEDPFRDDNERRQAWIGRSDWVYRTTFSWTPDGGAIQELVFDGIDTVATVVLNGQVLGAARNMHRTHRFDVSEGLVPGENILEVTIASPVAAADAASLALGFRPHANHHPYNAIRKAACSFGWDWGIDTSTSGLWRPVWIESWSGPRLAQVLVAGTAPEGAARLAVRAHVRSADAAAGLELHVAVGERQWTVPVDDGVASLDAAIDAELWWPRGHGEQALHEVEVSLVQGGDVIDAERRRIGFRSAEFVATDADGAGDTALIVNGQRIEVRGANWIPEDAFLPRITAERYSARIDDAVFAGINLLRVWGGGIFESEDFYDACDERGILTWQDFLFACAAYSEEPALAEEVELEAREAVARLASHPSLVVLNGNNENLWGRQDWGWETLLDGQSWGAQYYYEMLPAIVGELAPHVPYTPGSPFSPNPSAVQNSETTGTMHVWDVWNFIDHARYRDYRPRFVAEYGWQGPPTWATLTAFVSDDPLTPESPGMLIHQKAVIGNTKLTRGLIPHLRLPSTMEDWHWAMSLNQAVAVRTAIEWYRSIPECSGQIVWQLNDCWPVTSWAAVDSLGRAKPLLHALRTANAERLVTIQPDDDGLVVTLVNDTAADWRGDLVLDRRDYAGAILASAQQSVEVPARGSVSVTVPDDVSSPAAPESELVTASFDGTRGWWFFAEYRDSRLSDPGLTVDAERTERGWRLEVAAAALARDVAVLVDRVDPDARADVALVTLLPGERVTVEVTGALAAAATDFAAPSVLRSANQLVVGAGS